MEFEKEKLRAKLSSAEGRRDELDATMRGLRDQNAAARSRLGGQQEEACRGPRVTREDQMKADELQTTRSVGCSQGTVTDSLTGVDMYEVA